MNVAEVFVSLQGEGPYAGAPTVFVRFAGCNRACRYCDTVRWRSVNGARALSPHTVAATARDLVQRTRAEFIALTGGEPTVQSDLVYFLTLLRDCPARVYLETNASKPARVEACCRTGVVEVLAVNLKFPADDRYHRGTVDGAIRCGRIAARYGVEWFLKMVVTRKCLCDRTVASAARAVQYSGARTVILQPVTLRGMNAGAHRDLLIATGKLLRALRPVTQCVLVVPQLHRTVARLR